MSNQVRLNEIFGANVFNDAVMRQRLPKTIYREFSKVRSGLAEMTQSIADVLANAMKDWCWNTGRRIIPTGSSR